MTKKDEIEKHLRQNPGFYRATKIAIQFNISKGYAGRILSELARTHTFIERRMAGRNTSYVARPPQTK